MLLSETDPMYASYGCGLTGCDQVFQALGVEPQQACDPATGEPLHYGDGTPLLVQVACCDGEASCAQLAAHRERDCVGTHPEPSPTPTAHVVTADDGGRYLVTVDPDGTRHVDPIG